MLKIIIAVVAAVLGFLLGPLNCKILNKIPAEWLCDYDEKPSRELLSGKRFAMKQAGYPMGGVLAVAMATTVLLIGVSWELPLVILLYFVLMQISASDAKYTIIPDQFTVAVAVISAAFAVADYFTAQLFIKSWYSPILGAISGALLLIVLDIISTLLFKRAGFGFGDVKLLAAMGMFFGFPYTIVMLFVSFLIAASHFLVLILLGKAKKGIYMPMGPYICIAAALTVMLHNCFEYIFGMYRILLTMDALP